MLKVSNQNKALNVHRSRIHSVRLSVAAALVIAAWGSARAQDGVLPDVQVNAAAELPGDLPQPFPDPDGQVARGAHLGVLGKTDVMDAPFSVTSFTASTIRNSQARSVSEVIGQLDPSVREEYGDGTSLDSMMIRGFPVENDEMSLNGLPGILGQFRVSPEFVERAEVLKGPALLLNGMSPDGAVGGSVNVVSKRAGDVPLTSLNIGFASNSLWGFNADIGRRFGVDNAFGIRVNAGMRQGDLARDYVTDRARNASVGLDFTSTRLRASLDLIHQTETVYGAAGSVDLSRLGKSAPPALDGHRNFAQPWNYQDAEDSTVMGRVEFDLTEHLTVFGAIGHSRNVSTAVVSDEPYLDPAGNFAFAAMPVRWRQRTTSSQLGLKGRVDTGPVRHDWSITASGLRRESSAVFDVGGLSGAAGYSNMYDMIVLPNPVSVTDPMGPLVWNARTSLPGYALADTMSFADGKLLLTLGMRHQRVKSDSVTGYPLIGVVPTHYDQSVNSPMVAVVFKPTDQFSVYANHMQGLSMGDTAPYGTTNQGQVFAPYRTRQTEAGVKLDLGRFGGSVSVFQITKPYASIDPTTLTYGVFGEQRHRGLELNVFGEVTKGVRLLGGATFINATVHDSASPTAQNTRPVGVARRQIALQGEWDLPAVQGLTLTARGTNSSSVYADTTNLVRVPGWTVYDLGLRYAMKAGGTPVTLRAGLKNVSDKRYWRQGRYAASLGMPRTVALSSTFEF